MSVVTRNFLFSLEGDISSEKDFWVCGIQSVILETECRSLRIFYRKDKSVEVSHIIFRKIGKRQIRCFKFSVL